MYAYGLYCQRWYLISCRQIVLSDGIVLWRALVIWGPRKAYVVRTVSLILLLLTLLSNSAITLCYLPSQSFWESVLSAVSAHTDSCNGPSEGFDEGFEDTYGLAAFIFSFVTNVWATSPISYKAWYVYYSHQQRFLITFRGDQTAPSTN